MKEKPRLIKPKRTGKPAGRLVFVSGIYIGIKNEGDANTNEILYKAFTDGNIFPDLSPERKYHRGNPVDVWNVGSAFVKMLYDKKEAYKLKFDVYIEINFTLQLFKLLDPVFRKKAKNEHRKMVKELRKIKSFVQENPN